MFKTPLLATLQIRPSAGTESRCTMFFNLRSHKYTPVLWPCMSTLIRVPTFGLVRTARDAVGAERCPNPAIGIWVSSVRHLLHRVRWCGRCRHGCRRVGQLKGHSLPSLDRSRGPEMAPKGIVLILTRRVGHTHHTLILPCPSGVKLKTPSLP